MRTIKITLTLTNEAQYMASVRGGVNNAKKYTLAKEKGKTEEMDTVAFEANSPTKSQFFTLPSAEVRYFTRRFA